MATSRQKEQQLYFRACGNLARAKACLKAVDDYVLSYPGNIPLAFYTESIEIPFEKTLKFRFSETIKHFDRNKIP